jgi:acyl-CoA thioesterase FadM
LQRLKRFKLDYAYHIYNERGEFVAEGFTVLGSIDAASKPRPIPSNVEAVLLKASQGDGPRVLRS